MYKDMIARFTAPRLLPRIWNKLLSYIFSEQWIVLIAPSSGYKSLSWKNFKPLLPPADRFWADPFIWKQDDRYYIFIEEFPYSTHRGRIVCLALDNDMNILSNQVVLERPYHLSYPFLFKHNGQLYMIPETGENNGIELYRCTHFPDNWVFEKTLIRDVYAVDSTIIEAEGKWWLFANVKEKNGSTWDTLNLYYTNDPLSDSWTPHPLNPIVRDVKSARPAGHIFREDGKLIRPSQDCSVRYGYATNFNQITTLTEKEYVETRLHVFKPPLGGNTICATHTYNDKDGITVIDAIRRRRRISSDS